MKAWLALLCALLCGCAAHLARVEKTRTARIVVSPDQRGFQKNGQPFHPWGMNYGNHGRFMEDFWESDWHTFADDFHDLKAMGANVVRVHLQYGKFMVSADTPNEKALVQLKRTLSLAEEVGLSLDITGLACYRPQDTPPWYDAMDTPTRWQAQEKFWEIIAATCKDSAAVFCYDLINEPLSPGDKKQQWRSGSNFGGMDFLQHIALDPGGKNREDVAVAWIAMLRGAIRKHDTNALVTVGLLPWSPQWKHMSGFIPEKIAPHLDFISVHIYPETEKPGEALEGLKKFAAGKPVVIEETFPLSCDTAQLEEFIKASRPYATGWIGHYDGQTIKELDALEREKKLTIAQSIYRDWLRLFVRLGSELF